MTDYEGWTVEELKAEASERELEGRSSMNKDELVAALSADDDGQEAPAKAKAHKAAVDVLADARETVVEALKATNAELEADDHTDPERYQALKEDRELLLDALNHHLTLREQEAS